MIVRLIMRVEITDGVDPQQVVADCDYNFAHEDIVSTEIMDVEEVE